MRSILLSAAALSLACALPAASFAQEPSTPPEADKTATQPAKAKKHKTDKAEAPASASDASKPASETTAPAEAASNPPADEKAPPADEKPAEPKSATTPQ